jgi:hypothetical protein
MKEYGMGHAREAIEEFRTNEVARGKNRRRRRSIEGWEYFLTGLGSFFASLLSMLPCAALIFSCVCYLP